MAENTLTGLNVTFAIKNADGTPFHDLVMHKSSVESIIMSLGDKITGDVYYQDNTLSVTMNEYIEYNGIKYVLVSPPTIVREGMVSDNSELKGMTKYSFVFYHPMYMLGALPFCDVAVTPDQTQYLSESKTFSWSGTGLDFIKKLNKNLVGTQWVVVASTNQNSLSKLSKLPSDVPTEKSTDQPKSDVLSFDKVFVSDGLKTLYDTWGVPFVIDKLEQGEYYDENHVDYYSLGKRFVIIAGLPSNEILDENNLPYVFQFGQGVGLKNNSRTPKNNKIVTRIAGIGSERNIPYGYPQIRWYGTQGAKFTYGDAAGVYTNVTIGGHTFAKVVSYPIYKGVLGGQYVELIKHPFTRKNLMPAIYRTTLFNKISPYLSDGSANLSYNPDTVLVDYYDAPVSYPTPVVQDAPSYEAHEFSNIYPRLGNASIVSVEAYDDTVYTSAADFQTAIAAMKAQSTNQKEKETLENCKSDVLNASMNYRESYDNGGSYTYKYVMQRYDYQDGTWCTVRYTSDHANFFYNVYLGTHAPSYYVVWDDSMNDEGEYNQSYFRLTLPQLSFDMYACASITEEMNIVMRSGDCLGCTFGIQVDWEDYKKNFYKEDGTFDPVIHTTTGDGHVRDGNKYPDTSQGQVSVIVSKDINTFGTILPSTYQQPHANDKFVITGISLPEPYIVAAESELHTTSMEYMLENNVHYYDYPLKFDEYFLQQHPDILTQIRNNTIVRFMFAGVQNNLYVKQITVKYGDKPLPQYDIMLTDDVEVVLNQIGQTTEDVSRVRVQLNELQKYYGENIVKEIATKLSKTIDDVCQGRISFQSGLDSIGSIVLSDEIRSNQFTSGLYGGRGWRVDNLGNAEFESARVRSFLEIVQLVINRLQAQEGDTMFSDNDQIDKVDITYIAATPQSNDSPKAKYWYEVVDGEYVMTTDVSVVSSKTYYKAYYTLSLKEKWSGYFTSQKVGNILKGIVNTLAAMYGNVSDITEAQSVENDGANKFYTSWMVVVDPLDAGIQSISNNQIVVRLWEDNEGGDYDVSPQNTKGVPAGKNFIPCELMCIARWGCLDPIGNESSDLIADIRSRQQMFYISAKEGRIAKLTRVCQPILYEWNYGTTLGILPDFVRQWSIGSRLIDGRDYLYAQGVVVQDFIKVDYQGAPIVNYVDEGEWQNGTPYLHNAYNSNNMQWETSDVWHNGSYWRCKISQPYNNVYYEPTDANSVYWEKLLTSGDNAVLYELLPSLNDVSFARLENGGLTPASRTIKLNIKKTEGGTTTTSSITSYGSLFAIKWSVSEMPSSKTSGNGWGTVTVTGISWSNYVDMVISNTVTATNIYIALFDNESGRLLDMETIPIVKDGNNGNDGDAIQEQPIYRWDNSKPATPTSTAIPPVGWRLTSNYTWYLGGISDAEKVVVRIPFVTTQANATISLKATSFSEGSWDFGILGKLDNDNLETDSAADIAQGCDDPSEPYGSVVSGINSSIEKTYTITTEGEHFICIAYVKDGSGYAGEDCVIVDVLAKNGVDINMQLWRSIGKVVNGVLDGTWSEPVLTSGIDGADGLDGESAPFYTEEWYAWSSKESTAGAIDEPTPNSGWLSSIATQGGYTYLWKKIVKHTWNPGTRTYIAGDAQYFRMSGTNGTSINTKGSVNYAYNSYSDLPATSANIGKTAFIKSSAAKYTCADYQGTPTWISGQPASAGDAYTVKDAGNFGGGSLVGHLIQLNLEANTWLDLGQFKGENGVTYYTHIVWAQDVTIVNGSITNITGYTPVKPSGNSTYIWMGVHVDTNVDDPVQWNDTVTWEWTNTKGEKGDTGDSAAKANASVDKITILCNEDGSVASGTATRVTFGLEVGTNSANVTSCSVATPPTGVEVRGVQGSTNAKDILVTTSASASGIASGLTFTISGIYNGKTYSDTITIALIGAIKGSTGARGKIGRFFYFAGTFDSTSNTPLPVNDAQAPYFEHTEENQKRYHVYNPETNPPLGVISMADMWDNTESWNVAPWEPMTNDFKYLITQALFSDYAHLGSWIFNADFMMSEKGTGGNGDNGTRGTALFNGIGSNTGFKPNVVIDAFNGQASFGCDKIRFNADGSGFLANGNISWDVNGETTFKGSTRSPFMEIDYQSASWWEAGHNCYGTALINTAESRTLPEGIEYSGRRLIIANGYWNGEKSRGSFVGLNPAGNTKIFNNNGQETTTGILLRSGECIELLGYGDETTFYGWIVLGLHTMYPYS